MSKEEVKALFLDEAGQIYVAITPPLTPEQAWEQLEKKEEFWGNGN